MSKAKEKISVCIAAYDAALFLADTINSALSQSYQNIQILVAVDPIIEGELDLTTELLKKEFATNPKVRFWQNSQRLGWDKNLALLLRTVDTDLCVFLPHDDLWHPDYLSSMYEALSHAPKAAVAYGDMVILNGDKLTTKSVFLPNAGRVFDSLVSFFAQGGEAMPWRGLIRLSRLTEQLSFPTDAFFGFIVEVEFALSLLLVGCVHIQEVFYIKRVISNRTSASMERHIKQSTETKVQALTQARQNMVQQIKRHFDGVDADTLQLGIDYIHWRRYQKVISPQLPDDDVAYLSLSVQNLIEQKGTDLNVSILASRLALVLAEHYKLIDRKRVWSYINLAIELDPKNDEALLLLASMEIERSNPVEAIRLFSLVKDLTGSLCITKHSQRLSSQLSKIYVT